jgi:hypothetical protein
VGDQTAFKYLSTHSGRTLVSKLSRLASGAPCPFEGAHYSRSSRVEHVASYLPLLNHEPRPTPEPHPGDDLIVVSETGVLIGVAYDVPRFHARYLSFRLFAEPRQSKQAELFCDL